jgi:hypothetical protein
MQFQLAMGGFGREDGLFSLQIASRSGGSARMRLDVPAADAGSIGSIGVRQADREGSRGRHCDSMPAALNWMDQSLNQKLEGLMAEDSNLPKIIAKEDTDGIRLLTDRAEVAHSAVAKAHQPTETRRRTNDHCCVRHSKNSICLRAFLDSQADDLHLGNRRRRRGVKEKSREHCTIQTVGRENEKAVLIPRLAACLARFQKQEQCIRWFA